MSKRRKCMTYKNRMAEYIITALLKLKYHNPHTIQIFEPEDLCHTDNLIVNECHEHSSQHKTKWSKCCIFCNSHCIHNVRQQDTFKIPENTLERIHSVYDPGPLQYTFYSILNTVLSLDQGAAATAIARGFMALYNKIDRDDVKSEYLEDWMHSGEKIVVLKGYDHKHLKFLEDEVQNLGVDSYLLKRNWGRRHVILVLTVFGQEEELEEVFQGLSLLR